MFSHNSLFCCQETSFFCMACDRRTSCLGQLLNSFTANSVHFPGCLLIRSLATHCTQKQHIRPARITGPAYSIRKNGYEKGKESAKALCINVPLIKVRKPSFLSFLRPGYIFSVDRRQQNRFPNSGTLYFTLGLRMLSSMSERFRHV